MSVRQYIGARYVPKIYQNSQDPSSMEWENNTFEPFTIVSYNNNSFISRDFVPLNAGNPTVATTHWAYLAFTSGQIAQLQQDVADLNERVDEVKKHYYIIMSDSYGSYPGTDGYTFVEQAAIDNGLVEGETWYNFHQSGAGFAASNSFLELLQDSESVIDDPEKITDVIVIGSANDQGHDYNDIRGAIYTFKQYIATHYPNAKLTLASMSKSLRSENIAGVDDAVRAYQDSADQGCGFIENSQFAMTKISVFKSDMRHPQEAAVDMLGKLLSNYLHTGSMSVYRKFVTTANFELAGSDWQNRTGSNQPTFEMDQNNGVVGSNFALRGYINYGEMLQAKTLNVGDTRINSGIKMIDSFFWPRANNRTNWSCWLNTENEDLIPCTIAWDISTITNGGFYGDVVIHNNTGSSITLTSGMKIALLAPETQIITI